MKLIDKNKFTRAKLYSTTKQNSLETFSHDVLRLIPTLDTGTWLPLVLLFRKKASSHMAIASMGWTYFAPRSI